ncbi:MAG: hypothetical protein UX31_C0012G0022 [Candidatus Nomurabacteria bacterium GW2011_GWA1_46_11]|uniref:Uncharacterized protein n=1 Tax=Candidatus Nomurabacteria bacterium GW2011_GWA1_46_11 TaxID=1618732 RepID=A0A0G1NMX0_9BACT|nr:MAG: hypothetical protein UW69_C0094G0003 [Microgenomates group bacterium GW2011_GWA2_44_7]KKU21786.1 MAG: hypothetical protein UX31_C0012G0022 [Candidatus Nomurabacteria bacterium GW2011_GWA1_46_11]
MYTENMPKVYESGTHTEDTEVKQLIPPSGGVLSAFLSQPKWVTFDTAEDKEKVILVLKRHWVTNVPWILGATLFIFGFFVLLAFPMFSFVPARFQVVGVIFGFLIITAFIFENFLNWFYNVFVITDRRVIDIDFRSLIYREISQSYFGQVENVTFTQPGFWGTLFNYGTVMIQTAAEVVNIEFEDVPEPEKVVKVIISHMQASKEKTSE